MKEFEYDLLEKPDSPINGTNDINGLKESSNLVRNRSKTDNINLQVDSFQNSYNLNEVDDDIN